jgi:hypothetical protein
MAEKPNGVCANRHVRVLRPLRHPDAGTALSRRRPGSDHGLTSARGFRMADVLRPLENPSRPARGGPNHH